MPEPRPVVALPVTAAQVARELGVSDTSVNRWADDGHLECYRTPGGERRFTRAAVDTFKTQAFGRHGGR